MDFSSELSDFRLVIDFILKQFGIFNKLMWSNFIFSLVMGLFIISSVIFVFIRLKDK